MGCPEPSVLPDLNDYIGICDGNPILELDYEPEYKPEYND